jgi:hypothetical protein
MQTFVYRYPHVLTVAGVYIGLQPISTWHVAKGDITLESRNNAAGKARHIHEELIVNVAALDDVAI